MDFDKFKSRMTASALTVADAARQFQSFDQMAEADEYLKTEGLNVKSSSSGRDGQAEGRLAATAGSARARDDDIGRIGVVVGGGGRGTHRPAAPATPASTPAGPTPMGSFHDGGASSTATVAPPPASSSYPRSAPAKTSSSWATGSALSASTDAFPAGSSLTPARTSTTGGVDGDRGGAYWTTAALASPPPSSAAAEGSTTREWSLLDSVAVVGTMMTPASSTALSMRAAERPAYPAGDDNFDGTGEDAVGTRGQGQSTAKRRNDEARQQQPSYVLSAVAALLREQEQSDEEDDGGASSTRAAAAEASALKAKGGAGVAREDDGAFGEAPRPTALGTAAAPEIIDWDARIAGPSSNVVDDTDSENDDGDQGDDDENKNDAVDPDAQERHRRLLSELGHHSDSDSSDDDDDERGESEWDRQMRGAAPAGGRDLHDEGQKRQATNILDVAGGTDDDEDDYYRDEAQEEKKSSAAERKEKKKKKKDPNRFFSDLESRLSTVSLQDPNDFGPSSSSSMANPPALRAGTDEEVGTASLAVETDAGEAASAPHAPRAASFAESSNKFEWIRTVAGPRLQSATRNLASQIVQATRQDDEETESFLEAGGSAAPSEGFFSRKKPHAATQQSSGTTQDEYSAVASSSILAAEEQAEWERIRHATRSSGIVGRTVDVVRNNPRFAFVAATLVLASFVYFYARKRETDDVL